MSAPIKLRFKVRLEAMSYFYRVVEAETEDAAEQIAKQDLERVGRDHTWIHLDYCDDSEIYLVEEEQPTS